MHPTWNSIVIIRRTVFQMHKFSKNRQQQLDKPNCKKKLHEKVQFNKTTNLKGIKLFAIRYYRIAEQSKRMILICTTIQFNAKYLFVLDCIVNTQKNIRKTTKPSIKNPKYKKVLRLVFIGRIWFWFSSFFDFNAVKRKSHWKRQPLLYRKNTEHVKTYKWNIFKQGQGLNGCVLLKAGISNAQRIKTGKYSVLSLSISENELSVQRMNWLKLQVNMVRWAQSVSLCMYA